MPGATISLPDSTSTRILAKVSGQQTTPYVLYVQNFNTTTGVYIACNEAASTTSFYLPPADSATKPSFFILQSSGGDGSTVFGEWYAFQNSGGAVNVVAGRWTL